VITPPSLQRREYKYLIDELTADRIRGYIRGFCAVDGYAERTGGRYLTDTLYLDTPDFASYRATIDDAGDRYKLRIRSYPSLGGGPVYFEVKQRVSETIHKTRGAFRGDWRRLLEDFDRGLLDDIEPKHRPAIETFLCYSRRAPVLPAARVRYEREPYVSLIDDYARVTFDRSLSCQHAGDLSTSPAHERWCYIDDCVSLRGSAFSASSVLLELKFTSLVPAWMRQLVHSFDIQRLAFCKYTRAVDAMRLVPAARVARGGFWR
jgi:hypothetical protein